MSTFAKKLTFVMLVFGVSVVTVSQADAAGRCGRMSYRGSSSATATTASTEDGTVRRSFSYEPSYQPSYQPSYRSSQSYSAPKKEPWQYPKTDPRRYRN